MNPAHVIVIRRSRPSVTKFLNFAKRYFFSSGRLRATGKIKNISQQNVYVSRNPKEGRVGDRHMTMKGWLPSITMIHEVAGHAFLKITQPKLSDRDHNRAVTQFENNVRGIYIIDNSGNTIPGKAIPHSNE